MHMSIHTFTTSLSCLASPSPVAQLVDVVPVLRSGDPGTVGCTTVLQTGCGGVPQEDGGGGAC